jgi:hypothetical protein
MHIDNTYLTNRTLVSTEQPAPTPDATKGAARGAPPQPEASSHVPSPELLDLLQRVRQAPDVRQRVLQQVSERLKSGYYLTRAAAAQTADAIQKAQE